MLGCDTRTEYFCPWDGGSVEMKETISSHNTPWGSSGVNIKYFHMGNVTLQLKWDLNLKKHSFPCCPWATSEKRWLWKWHHFSFDCGCCVCTLKFCTHRPRLFWDVVREGWRPESPLNTQGLSPPSSCWLWCILTVEFLIRNLLPQEWQYVELNLVPAVSLSSLIICYFLSSNRC